MAEKKMCPHCGGQMFMAKIIRAGLVETTATPDEPYKVLKESKDQFDVEIVGCARCKTNITETDLVEGVKCNVCGKIVAPTEINAEGVCNVCDAVKQREELANASREDLIKMLLAAEKKANPVTAKIEKQMEKADAADSSNNSVNEDTTEKKKTRGKSRKRKDSEDSATEQTTDVTEPTVENVEEATEVQESDATETTENTVEAVEETVPVTEEVVDDIANQQEAPFPDIEVNTTEEIIQEPVPVEYDEPVVAEEQPVGAGFQMFDDNEEAF